MKEIAIFLLIFGTIGSSSAQSYPAKPVHLIAPSGPGSPSDIRARWIADKLTRALGQPVLVDNKAGAGGSIATEAAARSAPDGYTIVLVHQGTLAINPHLYERLGYDPMRDFAPVSRLVVAALLLAVHPDAPVKSVADLLQLARRSPGKLTFGSPGTGTPPHVAAELFRRMAGIDTVHVPYKSAAPALFDLMGGRLSYTFDSLAIQMPQVKAGKIRALGVTSGQRLAALPEIPTVAEGGLPGYEYWSWMGICAPAGTPSPIVARLNLEIVRILGTQQAKDWFAAEGGEPKGETPEEFAAFIRAEHARWGKIIREAGIRAE
ncbi:MAG TPA: tripartite tricarboxylate transporter substrate binding protein [Burkholderiales bacterium]|nr:tripartite tricarboxylate transporter substrate binding protein [Burkholderiales bacterium]